LAVHEKWACTGGPNFSVLEAGCQVWGSPDMVPCTDAEGGTSFHPLSCPVSFRTAAEKIVNSDQSVCRIPDLQATSSATYY